MLCEEFGCADARGVLLPQRLSRKELVDMVGCRVETLVRLLSAWKAAEIVSSPPGVTMLVRDLEALRVIAGLGDRERA